MADEPIENAIIGIIDAYANSMGNVFSNIVGTILLIFLGWLVYSIISHFLPGFDSFMRNTLFRPFRLLHMWFHLQMAKDLNRERIQEDRRPNLSIYLSFRFGSSAAGETEKSTVALTSFGDSDLTVRDAWKLANAPMIPTVVMLGILMMLTPFMMNNIILIIFHMYLLFGTVFILRPTAADNQFIMYTILAKTTISAWYMVYAGVVFLITVSIHAMKYELTGIKPPFWWVMPFLWGLYSVIIYFSALMTAVALSHNSMQVKYDFYRAKEIEKILRNQADVDRDRAVQSVDQSF